MVPCDFRSNGHKPVEFFLNTQATVQHLESDMYIKGNILFCEYQAILTTNGHYQQVVVGQHFRWPIYPYAEGIGVNATFSKVSHFVQKNETMVIIADKDNGCIRQLDRLTNNTVCLAGVCEKLTGISQKVVDGKRLDATFRRIDSMALYGSKLYIIESNAQRIRLLDFTTEQVSTVVTSSNFTLSHHKPHTMVVNPITGLMYVTTTYGIAEYNPGSNVFRYMVSYQQKGHQDGMLNESRWYYNDGMVFLINKTLIVADVNNENLRIIDLEAERVATWCFDNPRTISNCTITKPKALGVIDCTVYITTNRKISTIALPEGHCLRQQAEEDQISLTSVPNWVLNKSNVIKIYGAMMVLMCLQA